MARAVAVALDLFQAAVLLALLAAAVLNAIAVALVEFVAARLSTELAELV